MDISALAGTAVTLVAPYLAKGAEEFAKEVGREAFEKVRVLATRLQTLWEADPVTAAAANALPDKPERNIGILASSLEEEFSEDCTFKTEVAQLVSDVGADIVVVQEIEIANGVTGVDIEKMLGANINVTQRIKKGKNIVGVRGRVAR